VTYLSNDPITYTLVVVLVFVLTSLVFILYDVLVQKRQTVVMKSAVSANAVVSSLFPSSVQQRMLQNAEAEAAEKTMMKRKQHAKSELKNFLDDRKTLEPYATKPIADLFPETTVMFADISGFTGKSRILL